MSSWTTAAYFILFVITLSNGGDINPIFSCYPTDGIYSNVTYFEFSVDVGYCFRFANGKTAMFKQNGISTSFDLYEDESCTTVRRTILSNNCDVDTYFQTTRDVYGGAATDIYMYNCFQQGYVQLIMSSVQACRNDSVIYMEPLRTTTVINRTLIYNDTIIEQQITTQLTHQVQEIVLSLNAISNVQDSLTTYNENFDNVFENMNAINQKIDIINTQMTNVISLLNISNNMITVYMNNQIQIQNQLSQLLNQDSAKMLEYKNDHPTTIPSYTSTPPSTTDDPAEYPSATSDSSASPSTSTKDATNDSSNSHYCLFPIFIYILLNN